MAHNYMISLYLISLLLPLLSCHLLDEPLLAKSAYTKLDRTSGLSDSFTHLRPGQQKPNGGHPSSIFGFTKGGLTKIFKPRTRTRTPERNVLISWEVCYSIAQKVSGSSKSTEAQNMATTVLRLGRDVDLHHYNPQVTIEDIKSAITLFSISLENESLNTAERIWSVGVLAYLRSQLSEEYRNALHSTIPNVWTTKDLGRPRGQFLLFFLKDKDLGKVVQEMWSEFPSKLETSDYVSQEAIQRESIVHLIQQEMVVTRYRLSSAFQKIYLPFINLKTPIDPEKASSLVELILNRLRIPTTQNTDGFDEEKNMIRMLLHLEEYHRESHLQFTRSIRSGTQREAIVERDISFQLEDETLPPRVRSLLKEFENGRLMVKADHIPEILEILKDEQMSNPQLARLFRALNFLFNRNMGMYKSFQDRLDDHLEIVPRLFEMLTTRRYGRLDPHSFSWDSLEFLIYSDNEEQIAKQYRNDLANILVAKSVLSEKDIAPDSKHLRGYEKNPTLTRMLFGIFKQISAAKTFQHNDQVAEAILTEYILHLLAYKMGQSTLYRRILTYKHDPEILPTKKTVAFDMLSQQIHLFVKEHSWDHDDQFDEFKLALSDLEWRLVYVDMSLP